MSFFSANDLISVRKLFLEELKEKYDNQEIKNIFRECVASIMQMPFPDTLHLEGKRISESEMLIFNRVMKKLQTGEPVQYVLGEAWFCDMKLKIDANVLIPRPETEELCYLVKQNIKSPERILDWCTGSGCIALAMKKFFPEAEVNGLDVSEKALNTAKENAVILNLPAQFKCANALDPSTYPKGKWDVIMSNPPYITCKEAVDIKQQVKDFEPKIALFVENEDVMQFYRQIILHARESLNKNGLLALELNAQYASNAKDLLEKNGFKVEIVVDFHGKNRFALGWKN